MLAAFIVFLLLYNPFNLYFLSDDFDSIFNLRLKNSFLHSYRPFSELTIKADHFLWGKDAAGYHFTNILIHFLSSGVLFVFSRQVYSISFGKSETEQCAFFTALFFLFYPYHSESLFWIDGRGASLCTLMSLLSLSFYFKKNQGATYYFLSLLFFTIAALSYEASWVLPVIITLASALIFEKNRLKNEIKYIIGVWLVFLIYLRTRFYLTGHFIGSPYGTEKVLSADIFSKLKNFIVLFSRSFVPPSESTPVFIFYTFILLFLLSYSLYRLKNKWNLILKISLFSFVISILPFISFGIDSHDTEGERFLYLASVFVSIFFIVVLILLFKKQFTVIISIIIILEAGLLFYNYQAYEVASRVSKQTTKVFSTLKNSDTLYILNLPGQFRGAYIFRNGFESAVQLYTGVKNVNILSKSELENPSLRTFNISYFPLEIALKNGLADSARNINNAVIFKWERNGLQIYK